MMWHRHSGLKSSGGLVNYAIWWKGAAGASLPQVQSTGGSWHRWTDQWKQVFVLNPCRALPRRFTDRYIGKWLGTSFAVCQCHRSECRTTWTNPSVDWFIWFIWFTRSI